MVGTALQQGKRYNWAMVAIHWLMSVGLLSAIGMGLYMVSIDGITPTKLRLYNWHKWLGVGLFLLVFVRALVKLSSGSPRYPQHWGRGTVAAAKLGHFGLYVFMFAVPVFGYLFSLAAGYPVVWFGVIELPVIIQKNAELKEIFQLAHELSGKLLVALIAGHVLMALKHHFKDGDPILGRMIPGMRTNS